MSALLSDSIQHLRKLSTRYNQGGVNLVGFCEFFVDPDISNSYPTAKSAIIVPVSGKASFQFDKQRFTVKKGTLLHGCPGKTLSIKVHGQETFHYIAMYYNEDSDLLFTCALQQTDEILDILKRILELNCSNVLKDQYMLGQLIESFFALVFCDIEDEFDNTEQAILNTLFDYIQENFQNTITLRQLSSIVNEPPARISYIFYKNLGIRPIDYVIDYRMKEAIKLLKSTECNIATAARLVGYSDPCYFSRIFKKRMGFAPSRLKK